MSSERNILITKVPNYMYWKNNYINIRYYSDIFFQLYLLKNIIFFFFINSFSKLFLFKNTDNLNNFYISQILLNTMGNNIIISFSIYLQKNNVDSLYSEDNYLRLKYFYYLLNKSIIV